jgi:hypothetical protein
MVRHSMFMFLATIKQKMKRNSEGHGLSQPEYLHLSLVRMTIIEYTLYKNRREKMYSGETLASRAHSQ